MENAIVTWAVPVVENAIVMRTVLIVELLCSESNPKGAQCLVNLFVLRRRVYQWHAMVCMRVQVCTS